MLFYHWTCVADNDTTESQVNVFTWHTECASICKTNICLFRSTKAQCASVLSNRPVRLLTREKHPNRNRIFFLPFVFLLVTDIKDINIEFTFQVFHQYDELCKCTSHHFHNFASMLWNNVVITPGMLQSFQEISDRLHLVEPLAFVAVSTTWQRGRPYFWITIDYYN